MRVSARHEHRLSLFLKRGTQLPQRGIWIFPAPRGGVISERTENLLAVSLSIAARRNLRRQIGDRPQGWTVSVTEQKDQWCVGGRVRHLDEKRF